MTRREIVDVGSLPISYLTAGKGSPLALLLHGTYWSRVWQPVLEGIATADLRSVAGRTRLSEASVVWPDIAGILGVKTGPDTLFAYGARRDREPS